MISPRFGFHTGPTGNRDGITENYFRKLHDAGLPANCKGSDTMAGVYDLQELARARPDIGHVAMWRPSTRGQNDGYDYDVPNFRAHWDEAAAAHWAAIKRILPPELEPAITWVEVCNEIRAEVDESDPVYNDLHPVDYWGKFCVSIARLGIADGYKIACPAWNSGEPPNPVYYELSGQLEWLRYLETESRALQTFHEYNFGHDNFAVVFPYHYGRFQALFTAADSHGIARPRFYVSETGWSLDRCPPAAEAIPFLQEAGAMYAGFHEQWLGSALWALNGYLNVDRTCQPLIQPVGDWTVATRLDTGDSPNTRTAVIDGYGGTVPGETVDPGPPAETLDEHLRKAAKDLKVVSYNRDAALQKEMNRDLFGILGSEGRTTFEGTTYAVQPAGSLDTDAERYYAAVDGQWDNVFYGDLRESGEGPTPPPADNFIDVELLAQCDERWSSHPTGTGPRTLCQWGCLLVVYDMLGRHWQITDRLPDAENDHYVAAGGFSGEYLVSMAMSKVYGRVGDEGWRSYQTHGEAMVTKIREYLEQGIPVPARVDFRPTTPEWDQHWILIVGHDGTDWLMNDPWHNVKAAPVSAYYGRPSGESIAEAIFYYLQDEPVEPPPAGPTLDVAFYQVAEPDAFRVVKNVDANGHETNQNVQDWAQGDQMALHKNVGHHTPAEFNIEWYQFVNGYRERIQDTSHSPTEFYRMTQDGTVGGRVNPDRMTEGVQWNDSTTHEVKFYNKANCAEVVGHPSAGSVRSFASATLERNVVFNTYGQNLTFDEVLYLETNNGERQMYGVYNGRRVGWIGWVAAWGTAEPVEIRFDRGRLVERPYSVCDW